MGKATTVGYYILYVIYNLIAWVLILWIILLAITYLNDFFIPNNLKWTHQGTIRKDLFAYEICHFFIAVIETLGLLLCMFALNEKFLKAIKNIKSKKTAFVTGLIKLIMSICLIAFELLSSR